MRSIESAAPSSRPLRRQGAPSTAAWLAGRLRLRPGEAKTRVELANRLDPHAPDGPVDYAANVAAPA